MAHPSNVPRPQPYGPTITSLAGVELGTESARLQQDWRVSDNPV